MISREKELKVHNIKYSIVMVIRTIIFYYYMNVANMYRGVIDFKCNLQQCVECLLIKSTPNFLMPLLLIYYPTELPNFPPSRLSSALEFSFVISASHQLNSRILYHIHSSSFLQTSDNGAVLTSSPLMFVERPIPAEAIPILPITLNSSYYYF